MFHTMVKFIHKGGLYTVMAVHDESRVRYYEIRRLAYGEFAATHASAEPSRLIEPYNVAQGAWKLDALVEMLEAYLAKHVSE